MIICPKCYSQLCEETYEKGVQSICSSCQTDIVPIDEYTVTNIPTSWIFSDTEFNCRGRIMPVHVMDLVEDIRNNGLQFPIAVQPWKDAEIPDEYEFRIIAGHRRFQALVLLKRETVPCMVKVGLSEVQARLLNLGENMKRQELNIMQEATAISHLRRLGLNRREVSDHLGVSSSWVQVRFNLLDMDPAIQEEAAAGMLNQHQIKTIYGLKDKERQFEAVRKIKDAKLRGVRGLDVAKKPSEDPFKKKRQAKNIVQEMIDHMGKTVGYGLHTRCLAWANGEISSADLYIDIKTYAEEIGVDYHCPVAGLLT